MRKVSIVTVMVVLTTGFAFADTFGSGDSQFDIDFVDISSSTNPTSGYGIVNYNYRMGTYEITNDQWDKFKAEYGKVTGDPSSAYDRDLYWTSSNVPTNNVSWYEAAQFVNYLNVSSGHQAAYNFTGTQGTRYYTLATWSEIDAWEGENLYRHKDAHYFLPTENEWVKAAYWNGSSIQTYATTDGSAPVEDVDSNYGYELGVQLWDVGNGTEEINGTYDMMGNVYEWMESPYSDENFSVSSSRVLRGGGYGDVDGIASSSRYDLAPDIEYDFLGFRVASVPEPSSLILLSAAGLFLRKRRG